LGDDTPVAFRAPTRGASRFGRPYKAAYALTSPYMDPTMKPVNDNESVHIVGEDVDQRPHLDINFYRAREDPSIFLEFEQWYDGSITVHRMIEHPRMFYTTLLLRHDPSGWLGDEVYFFKFLLYRCIS
jgi:hypothetical protein